MGLSSPAVTNTCLLGVAAPTVRPGVDRPHHFSDPVHLETVGHRDGRQHDVTDPLQVICA